MNPIVFAMRHPITMMVGIVAVVLGAGLAIFRMPVDIFPDLNVPVIYVAQPYGGLDPQQMEGFLTNYYEYHFLYITGIDHVESKNIQSVATLFVPPTIQTSPSRKSRTRPCSASALCSPVFPACLHRPPSEATNEPSSSGPTRSA